MTDKKEGYTGAIIGLSIFVLIFGFIVFQVVQIIFDLPSDIANRNWDITFTDLESNTTEVQIKAAFSSNPIRGGHWVESSTNKWTMPISVAISDYDSQNAEGYDSDEGKFFLSFRRVTSERKGLSFERVLDAKAFRWKTGERWKEVRKFGKKYSEGEHMSTFGYQVEMRILCTNHSEG